MRIFQQWVKSDLLILVVIISVISRGFMPLLFRNVTKMFNLGLFLDLDAVSWPVLAQIGGMALTGFQNKSHFLHRSWRIIM